MSSASSVSVALAFCGLVLACPALAAEDEMRSVSTPEEASESAPDRRDETAQAAVANDDAKRTRQGELTNDGKRQQATPKLPPSSRGSPRPSEFRGPDVTLIAGEERTIYEYRHNGQLRMIKVVPKFGKPYYLAPRDPTRGFGDLEQADTLIAEWVLWEF